MGLSFVRCVMLMLVFVSIADATPTPLPGPRCNGGVPIANQSGLLPDCPGNLLEHNATCTTAGEGCIWAKRAQFHVGSVCHGENDPNGLVYHLGVYHLFFQDHVGGGTVGGHIASRDFIHWRRLPIALWNDMWYDKSAIWTFSATVVNNIPTMIYPGIGTPNASGIFANCTNECFTHNIAIPYNVSDPWLVDWVKPEYNPIASRTQRDPSTAWQTANGEWRYTNCRSEIFSSRDFKRWSKVGTLDTFGGGECPDFFPIPPICDNCNDNFNDTFPTHVHATSAYNLGTYSDGKPNTTGIWTLLPNWKPVHMDGSQRKNFYASKSFWDPVKQRRIVWGWIKLANILYPESGFRAGSCPGVGSVMTNTNSLPREVRYDPSLQRLLFFPVDEMKNLRGAPLFQAKPQHLKGRLVATSGKKGNQIEIHLIFRLPSNATRVGATVMGGVYPNGTRFGVDVFIDFVPNTKGEETWSVSAGQDSSSMLCPNVTCETKSTPLLMKASDKTLTIAIWVDNVVVEAYFMGGREYWTIPLPCQAIKNGDKTEIFANSNGADLMNATIWPVKSLKYENIGPSIS